jgi:hypothetical protein
MEVQMPSTDTDANTGSLMVNIFDGARQPIRPGTQILLRVRDVDQKELPSQSYDSSSILVRGLPFYNNFGDNDTVVVSAEGYKQAGFTPIKISPNTVQSIDLMLLPSAGSFNFRDALWPTLQQKYPSFAALLAHGTVDNDAAQDRYSQLNHFGDLLVSGFFTSESGIKDLPYLGNEPQSDWQGCPTPVLAKLGLLPERTRS